MKRREEEASMVADLDEAERVNEQINELREKAIILKNLKMIQRNERAVA